MEDLKKRLLVEQEQLNERVDGLQKFLRSEGFKKLEQLQQELLTEQLVFMIQYKRVLNTRIQSIFDPSYFM